jgi:hypothetical protein
MKYQVVIFPQLLVRMLQAKYGHMVNVIHYNTCDTK